MAHQKQPQKPDSPHEKETARQQNPHPTDNTTKIGTVQNKEENHYRTLFEYAPISLLEEDFSEIKRYLDRRRAAGITDFGAYFRQHPQELRQCLAMVKIVDANKVALEMFQVQSKEELLRKLPHLFTDNSYDAFAEELIVLTAGNFAFKTEGIRKTVRGKEIYVSLELVIPPGYEENWSKVIIAIKDITAHKQVEEALRESEKKFWSLLNFASQGLILVDEEGVIVLVNAMTEKIFNYHRDELIGKKVELLLPPPSSEAHIQYRSVYLKNPQSIPMEHRPELMGRRKNGSEFPVQVGLSYIETNEGILMMGLITDVTERKQAEAKLQQTLAELARSNANLEQFAYVASHDLQEPLRMVSSYLQLLSRRYQGQLDADADEFIAFAVNGAKRMQSLIDDLLTYSRIGTRGKDPTPTDTETIVNRVLDNLHFMILDSQAAITHDPLPVVMADDSQFMQLFQNLIGNALKFRGEKRPEIHIGVQRQGGMWQFAVKDNGIGIEGKYFERIFSLFQRLHTQREYEGTGIGLALCKKIVERHNGRIWLESEPGVGSTFYFTVHAMME